MGAYSLQEGGYHNCTEMNRHVRRNELTALLNVTCKGTLQYIINRHIQCSASYLAIRLLAHPYYMFEQSSPKLNDANSKEVAITAHSLPSEFQLMHLWDKWVLPALKSMMRRDCPEHFCVIVQCAVQGRRCMQDWNHQLADQITHTMQH